MSIKNDIKKAFRLKYSSIVAGLTKMLDKLEKLKEQERAEIAKQNEAIAKANEAKVASEKEIALADKSLNAIRNIVG